MWSPRRRAATRCPRCARWGSGRRAFRELQRALQVSDVESDVAEAGDAKGGCQWGSKTTYPTFAVETGAVFDMGERPLPAVPEALERRHAPAWHLRSVSRSARRLDSVADARHYARRRLPRAIMQQIENGAGTMRTHDANVRAFEEVLFRPCHGIWTERRDQGGRARPSPRTPLIASSIGALKIAHPTASLAWPARSARRGAFSSSPRDLDPDRGDRRRRGRPGLLPALLHRRGPRGTGGRDRARQAGRGRRARLLHRLSGRSHPAARAPDRRAVPLPARCA